MHRLIRIVHFLALAIFLGSIFGHIVLGRMAAADPAVALPVLEAKLVMTYVLTLPGLGALVISGAALAFLTRKRTGLQRWLVAKLALVVAVALNGALVLTPIAAEEVALARAGVGALSPVFEILAIRESIAGALNLAAILAIVALAAFRPALRASGGALPTRT
ncbi:MAG TPA: DUF2269 family protein [Alphaproteobacteria bacterium]|jgi:hypothetical protein